MRDHRPAGWHLKPHRRDGGEHVGDALQRVLDYLRKGVLRDGAGNGPPTHVGSSGLHMFSSLQPKE